MPPPPPPPPSIIRDSLAAIRDLGLSIDSRLGYPKTGTDVGGGTHAGDTTTDHYAVIVKHPGADRYALQVDETIDAILTDSERAEVVDDLAAEDPAWAGAQPFDPYA